MIADTAIFLGPSLPHERAQVLLPRALLFGPAGQGDIYRLLALPLKRIILIDGVFHGRPAVWQRELLAAATTGIELVGAASMGALRAAECGAFGMLGIGEIYAAYCNGRLAGDDEVALLHGDAHHHFRPLSLPLVNVRATLAKATRMRLIKPQLVQQLLTAAITLPFAERVWPNIWQAAGLAPDPHTDAVLRKHRVDLKAADAERCLRWAAYNSPAPAQHEPWWAASFRQNQRYHATRARQVRGVVCGNGLVPLGKVCAHMKSREDWDKIFNKTRTNWVWRQMLRGGTTPITAETSRPSSFDLARQGMSQREFARTEAARAADETWLDQQAPLALPEQVHQFVNRLAAKIGWPESEAQRQFGLLFLLAEWVTHQGLTPNESALAPFKRTLARTNIADSQDWRNFVRTAAIGSWVLVQSPATFGYDDDDLEQFLLESLQRNGDIAAVAEALTPVPLPQPKQGQAVPGQNPPIGENPITSCAPILDTHFPDTDENPTRFCTQAVDGGQRICRPETTLHRMRPHWARFGITRLAEVTRLDLDFGVPTFCAIRPTALVLQTSNGKGLTRSAAQASALMEAVELWHAENPPPDLPFTNAAHYQKQGAKTLPWAGMNANRRLHWVTAQSLDRQKTIQVPADKVWFTRPSFGRTTTNGLASGNHRLEAEIHAVYECLERDALARLDQSGALQLNQQSRLLDTTTVPAGTVHDLITRIENSGCLLKIVVVPTRARRTTCWALLIDPSPSARVSTLNSGAGCHDHPLIALSRAVTEAVQSRLSFVHGGREDIINKDIGRTGNANDAATRRVVAHISALRANTAYHDLDPVKATCDDLNQTHQQLVADLKAEKLDVWSVRLTKSGLPIDVVKVFMPQLEFHRKLA